MHFPFHSLFLCFTGRSSESPAPAANLDPNSGGFMRPNSMKSWKVEHDRQVAEEEKKKQDKDKKGGRKSARSRSASPKKVNTLFFCLLIQPVSI